MKYLRNKKGQFIKGNSPYMKGRKHTDETKRKIREIAKDNPNYGMRGKCQSPEAKRKIKIAHTGKVLSEETKKKISLSHIGLLKGKNHPNWKGGITISGGYVLIYMPNHPNNMNGYINRSHLVAEKALGRYLDKTKGEMVHHINKIKNDDRNCNLLICTKKFHYFIHKRMRRIGG